MLKHINIAAAFLLMAVGCSDLNDIKDRLDSAESRLEALETQVNILKGNLETLTKCFTQFAEICKCKSWE